LRLRVGHEFPMPLEEILNIADRVSGDSSRDSLPAILNPNCASL